MPVRSIFNDVRIYAAKNCPSFLQNVSTRTMIAAALVLGGALVGKAYFSVAIKTLMNRAVAFITSYQKPSETKGSPQENPLIQALSQKLDTLIREESLLQKDIQALTQKLDKLTKDIQTQSQKLDNLISKFESLKTNPPGLIQHPVDKFRSPALLSQRIQKDEAKMLKNSQKALDKHRKKDSTAPYARSLPPLKTVTAAVLNFQCFAHEEQGTRPTMEDFHFTKEIDEGLLIGVLDGHTGVAVAKYASKIIQNNFSRFLKSNQGNVRKTLKSVTRITQSKIEKRTEFNHIGSTAVICFIDKKTHKIYTATIGDSEANIYRKINGQFKSIPLSCVRDWTDAKEIKRASVHMKKPEIEQEWPLSKEPKRLQFSNSTGAINVSRSFGDVRYQPGVISKAKLSIHQAEPGDILVLACDGFKDYVTEDETIQILGRSSSGNPAKDLTMYALNDKKSGDNVTVGVVRMQ